MNEIFIVVVIVIILFFLVSLGLMIFAIVYVVKEVQKPQSAAATQNEQKAMQADVEGKKAQLTPWQGHSYADITTHMNYKYSRSLAFKLTGTAYSTKGEPIIYFNRVERGIRVTGYMFAASTDFNLFYQILSHEHFAIRWNGELLGEIRKNGDLVNAKGQVIGHAKHPPQAEYTTIDNYKKEAKSNFPLTMNGRSLATIRVATDLANKNMAGKLATFLSSHRMLPVIETHDKPSPEEEKWLTALAVLEVAFYGYALV